LSDGLSPHLSLSPYDLSLSSYLTFTFQIHLHTRLSHRLPISNFLTITSLTHGQQCGFRGIEVVCNLNFDPPRSTTPSSHAICPAVFLKVSLVRNQGDDMPIDWDDDSRGRKRQRSFSMSSPLPQPSEECPAQRWNGHLVAA